MSSRARSKAMQDPFADEGHVHTHATTVVAVNGDELVEEKCVRLPSEIVRWHPSESHGCDCGMPCFELVVLAENVTVQSDGSVTFRSYEDVGELS